MTTYPYIILSDDAAQVSKRFRVIKMNTPWERTDSFQITLGGNLDKAVGVILETFQYVFKVPAETDDMDYGEFADLRSLYFLNNPNGTPSDLLTLTDHYGTTHYVKFNESTAPEPLTTQLEGPNAWHYFNISLIKISGGGSGS